MSGNPGTWESSERLPGDFNIGHTKGALCYLIDDEGRPRSEGYHEIRAERPDAGPPDSIEYVGRRGASKYMIAPIRGVLVKRD